MNLPQNIKTKRTAIIETAARRGARNVRIFGSVIRGEATDKSDVDFLVDLEPGRTLFDLGGLDLDLQELLKTPVDIVTERSLSRYIRKRVLTEAIPL